MKRFEHKIALGTVVVTVFEDRTVIELIGATSDETDQLFQVPFTERAQNVIMAAMGGENTDVMVVKSNRLRDEAEQAGRSTFYKELLELMEPEGHA